MKSTFAQYVIGFMIQKLEIQMVASLREQRLKIFLMTGFARFAA